MPDGELNYELIERLTATTLPNYMDRPGRKNSIINETLPRTLMAGHLFKAYRTDWKGGTRWTFRLQFTPAEIGEWVGVGKKLGLRSTKAPTEGSVPRRFYQWGHFVAYAELDHNKGEQEVTIDLLELIKSDVGIAIVTAFENAITAYDGNYAHDGVGDDFLLPFGWRYWATIDGLHITGDTTKDVGGINPSTQPLWKNGYINPNEGIDGMGAITSVYELRRALNRAVRWMKFESAQVWGPMARDIKNTPSYDAYSKSGKPDKLMICADPVTVIDYEEVVFDRNDNVGKDQGGGRPIWKGIEAMDMDAMGFSSNGYGYDPDGNELWTDRGGNYANGSWPNTGEVLLTHSDYFHFLVEPKHFPFVAKSYRPEGMMGIGHEGDAWAQTACRSRRRGLFYIAGFEQKRAA